MDAHLDVVTEDGRRTMSRRTLPRKLNIGNVVTGPSPSANGAHQTQGIAALFAITFDLRVTLPHALAGADCRRGIQLHGSAQRVFPLCLRPLS